MDNTLVTYFAHESDVLARRALDILSRAGAEIRTLEGPDARLQENPGFVPIFTSEVAIGKYPSRFARLMSARDVRMRKFPIPLWAEEAIRSDIPRCIALRPDAPHKNAAAQFEESLFALHKALTGWRTEVAAQKKSHGRGPRTPRQDRYLPT